MKNKIMFCLVLLFLSINGWSQFYIDSSKVKLGTPLIENTTIAATGRFLSFSDSSVIKYDTVKVIMLICETSHRYYYGIILDSLIIDSTSLYKGGYTYHKDTTDYGVNNNVYWQFGYEVREHYWDYHPDFMVFNEQMSIRHIDFLDENKKPLSKNIIIWQSQSVK